MRPTRIEGIFMLMIMAAFAVFASIMHLLDIPFKNRIKSSTSVEESLKARKRLRVFRSFWSLLLIAVFCVIIAFLTIINGNGQDLGRSIGMIIGFAILEGWSKLHGNVQANSKDGYMYKHKKDGYMLYLRAFESDYYSTNPKDYSFEGALVKAIKKRQDTNVCAIGMTKELDAPYGAERVYVSDESWKGDVLELMQFAEKIFILMDDRQSCLWEIVQSANMLDKTCFIISTEEKYTHIRKELSTKINFPEFNDLFGVLKDKQAKVKFESGMIKLGLMFDGNDYSVFEIDEKNLKGFIREVLDKGAFVREVCDNFQNSTKKILWGAIVFCALGILSNVFSILKYPFRTLWNYNAGLLWLLGIIVGYIIYYRGLGKLIVGSTWIDKDAKGLGIIRKAAMLSLLGIVCSYMFYIMAEIASEGMVYVGVILYGMAGLFNTIGFGILMKSRVFSSTSGAKILFSASILSIICIILFRILKFYLLGNIIEVASFIMIIIGWYKIKNAFLLMKALLVKEEV